MKQDEKQDHFNETDQGDEEEKCKKIPKEPQKIVFAEAKPERPPHGEGRSKQKADVYAEMNGQIEDGVLLVSRFSRT